MNPGQRRHLAAQQPPLEVIPAQVLCAVLLLDLFGPCLSLLEDVPLLRFKVFPSLFDRFLPDLMAVPPHLIPALLVGGRDSIVTAAEDHAEGFSGCLIVGKPLDEISVVVVASGVAVRAEGIRGGGLVG